MFGAPYGPNKAMAQLVPMMSWPGMPLQHAKIESSSDSSSSSDTDSSANNKRGERSRAAKKKRPSKRKGKKTKKKRQSKKSKGRQSKKSEKKHKRRHKKSASSSASSTEKKRKTSPKREKKRAEKSPSRERARGSRQDSDNWWGQSDWTGSWWKTHQGRGRGRGEGRGRGPWTNKTWFPQQRAGAWGKDADTVQTPGPTIEPLDEASTGDDYWAKAKENALNDPNRFEAANRVPPPVLAEDEVLAKAWEETLPDIGCPISIRKNLVLTLSKAGLSTQAFENPLLEWTGAGYEAAYVPLKIRVAEGVQQCEEALHYYTVAHGTQWNAAAAILYEGVIRPQSWTGQDLPTTSFFGQVALGEITDGNVKDVCRRLYAAAKGQQGAIMLSQAKSEVQHSSISGGGNWLAMNASRYSGLCRTPDAWCVRSNLAVLKGVAIIWPA